MCACVCVDVSFTLNRFSAFPPLGTLHIQCPCLLIVLREIRPQRLTKYEAGTMYAVHREYSRDPPIRRYPDIRRYTDIKRSKSLGAAGELHYSTHNPE